MTVELNPGMHFRNVHMPNHLFKVKTIDEANNLIAVEIIPENTINRSPWTENDWNLQHTLVAFDRYEYYPTLVTSIDYRHCGGCGATNPTQRCLGCLHQF